MLRVSLVTGPTKIPISLDDLKDELKITHPDEDGVIVRDINAAVAYAENYTETKIMTQTWEYYFDDFPTGDIILPYPPLASVTSLKYYNSSNVLTTLDTSEYLVDSVSKPGRIEYVDSWPSVYDKHNAAYVRFVCGYTNQSDVPQGIKDAIILLAADFYVNRQDSMYSMGSASMTQRIITSRNLLDFHKIFNPASV